MHNQNTQRILTLILWGLGAFLLMGCPNNGGPGAIAPGGSANLTVRVVDAVSQSPIQNARVSLKLNGEVVGTEQASDGNGLATFPELPASTGYKAFASSVNGFAPGASPSIRLLSDQTVVIPMQPSLSQGAGLIAGSVKDIRTKLALPGVSVTLSAAGIASQRVAPYGVRPNVYPMAYRVQQVGQSVISDDAGQFTFEQVPPGAYTLVYSLSGYPEAQRQIQVIQGEPNIVETVFMGDSSSQTPGTGNPATQGHVLITEPRGVYQLSNSGERVFFAPTTNAAMATRLPDDTTLIADEGANQVRIVSLAGDVLWDMAGLFSRLNRPSWVDAAQDGRSFLVTDSGNGRIIEVEDQQRVWEFPGLNNPRSATYVSGKGTVLIADTGNARVIEVDRASNGIVWEYGLSMQAPAHAVRLSDGDTLITDAAYHRIIRVKPNKQVSLFFDGGVSEGGDPAAGLLRPSSTMPTRFGTFLVADTGHNRILELDANGQVVNQINGLSNPKAIERL